MQRQHQRMLRARLAETLQTCPPFPLQTKGKDVNCSGTVYTMNNLSVPSWGRSPFLRVIAIIPGNPKKGAKQPDPSDFMELLMADVEYLHRHGTGLPGGDTHEGHVCLHGVVLGWFGDLKALQKHFAAGFTGCLQCVTRGRQPAQVNKLMCLDANKYLPEGDTLRMELEAMKDSKGRPLYTPGAAPRLKLLEEVRSGYIKTELSAADERELASQGAHAITSTPCHGACTHDSKRVGDPAMAEAGGMRPAVRCRLVRTACRTRAHCMVSVIHACLELPCAPCCCLNDRCGRVREEPPRPLPHTPADGIAPATSCRGKGPQLAPWHTRCALLPGAQGPVRGVHACIFIACL